MNLYANPHRNPHSSLIKKKVLVNHKRHPWRSLLKSQILKALDKNTNIQRKEEEAPTMDASSSISSKSFYAHFFI